MLQTPTRLPLSRSCCAGQSPLTPSSAAAGGCGRPSAQAGARGLQASPPVLMASPLSSTCRHSPPLSNGIITAVKGCAAAATASQVSPDPQAMPARRQRRDCRAGCLSRMSCCCGVQVSSTLRTAPAMPLSMSARCQRARLRHWSGARITFRCLTPCIAESAQCCSHRQSGMHKPLLPQQGPAWGPACSDAA